jgi:hypothetical protein
MFAISGSYTSTLLATMLESIQGKEREPGYILTGAKNAEDAATFAQVVSPIFNDSFCIFIIDEDESQINLIIHSTK